jgi:translation elongation factor aEF-1 beta
MAKAVVTVQVMPTSTDVDMDALAKKVAVVVAKKVGEGDTRLTIEPIAFGLKRINYIFVMEESLGSPDLIAEDIQKIEGVESAEISDVRRAIG